MRQSDPSRIVPYQRGYLSAIRKDADDFARFGTCMMGIQGKHLTYRARTRRPGVVEEAAGTRDAGLAFPYDFTCTIRLIKPVNFRSRLQCSWSLA